MQLYYARPSPFVRKVMVLLEEAGKVGEVELIDGFGSPVSPNEALIAVNPIGKIPSLILEDGRAIYDSRVVTRYLDAIFDTGFYPDDEKVWTTLTLEAHADGILDAAILCVYEVRCRNEEIRSADWVSGQHAKICRGLDYIKSLLFASCYAMLGDERSSKSMSQNALVRRPALTVSDIGLADCFRQDYHRQLLRDALRLSGLPE